ncbi:MAG: hypothetical protein OES14_03415 [Nitrosopumilus sp.]|nr:hypothetical protein [Nitrosopumilus sp.]MDH3824819.1 hypothetical protein [Nitrosopumilus sp.]
MSTKEGLQRDMVVANEEQKDLRKTQVLLLGSKKSKDKKETLRITKEITKLQDFIMMGENTLKMQIKLLLLPKNNLKLD